MLIFWLPGQKSQTSPKINKFPSAEEILCIAGFYKLPFLPQKSQIYKRILNAQALLFDLKRPKVHKSKGRTLFVVYV
jgi:hypothetical protein